MNRLKACSFCFGAGNQNRTDDLVITNDVLYRLSHTSRSVRLCHYTKLVWVCQYFFEILSEKSKKYFENVEKIFRVLDKLFNIWYTHFV